MIGNASISFAPLLPWPLIAAGAAALLGIASFALMRRARGAMGWLVAGLLIAAALANPAVRVEQREDQRDVAVVVVDRSASQKVVGRDDATDAATAAIRDELDALGNLDVRVVTAGDEPGDSLSGDGGTRLFGALDRALADIPGARFAGAVMVTDGQAHDAPAAAQLAAQPGPVHVVLTGRRGERDRRVTIVNAPSFGLIDKTLSLTARVDDLGAEPAGGTTRLIVRQDGAEIGTFVVPVGRDTRVEFKLDRAGPSIVEVEAEPGADELTAINNRAAVSVNGVRERLRVLLISGEPHAGERAWRNLLKADPGVDLVHFTILRPPEKQDGTPVRELSLISFPVRELFEVKLEEFDLVIFDRYRRRGVILQRYVANIVDYVRNGGALLAAVGPTFAGPLSLYNTPLGEVLPAAPTGDLATDAYRPGLTDIGLRHPVTAPLARRAADEAHWGRWFRYVGVLQTEGTALMSGPGGKPLLILNRVAEGRVAMLASDHIWLWSRGYDGGGPQAELVRRLAHWLMREPELEEDRMTAEVEGGELVVERRTLEPVDAPVTVTGPDGAERTFTLGEGEAGVARTTVPIDLPGVYRVSDGARTAIAAAGDATARELGDVRASDAALGPVAEATGGGVVWLEEDGAPDLRRVRADQVKAGRNAATGRPWLGLVENRDYVVTGLTTTPLLPGLAILLLVLALLFLAWRREGR